MGVTEKGGNKVDELTLFRLASVKNLHRQPNRKIGRKGQLDWQQPIHELAQNFSLVALIEISLCSICLATAWFDAECI